jgi:hypothetical protein
MLTYEILSFQRHSDVRNTSMRLSTTFFPLIVTGILLFSYSPPKDLSLPTKGMEDIAILVKVRNHADSLKKFAEKEHYNTSTAFLVDMSIPSGKKRFFVYNMIRDSIELTGLVTNGNVLDNKPVFSNTPGSNCSSLGKYKIGYSYNGTFGLAYKLYGLDPSNNKAFERFVVLHSHRCVPDYETLPADICTSWGCPTVSPAFLMKLKPYIEGSRLTILLYMFY